ncbi:hypothetical protein TNCV_2550791 [Trichonephila clavipes]|nr:hypothetical protein TNCV_2550791 [Trichonephila clavipes]
MLDKSGQWGRQETGSPSQSIALQTWHSVAPQPPYSIDFAPLDFWLFPKLKETLKGQRFSMGTDIQAATRKWIGSQPQFFYMNGMKKWIKRLNKYVAISGDYGEKRVYNMQE